ncbi:MAG: hypothetical protein Q9190_000392 [Brigantiaea leucoxantha]
MDDATADLILSLQWQDLSDSAERDASLADQLISDYIVAIDFYKRELEGLATNIVDHHFSETLANSTNENEHLKPVNPLPKFEEVKNTLSRLRLVELVLGCNHITSATSAAFAGSSVVASSGGRTVFLEEPKKSLIEIVAPGTMKRQHYAPRSRRLLRNYVNDTIATMNAGG